MKKIQMELLKMRNSMEAGNVVHASNLSYLAGNVQEDPSLSTYAKH
jgi:hypothetical protein